MCSARPVFQQVLLWSNDHDFIVFHFTIVGSASGRQCSVHAEAEARKGRDQGRIAGNMKRDLVWISARLD